MTPQEALAELSRHAPCARPRIEFAPPHAGLCWRCWEAVEAHHIAMYAREAARFQDALDTASKSIEESSRVREWRNLSADDLRLRCGELTPAEVRTVRAVLDAIVTE